MKLMMSKKKRKIQREKKEIEKMKNKKPYQLEQLKRKQEKKK